LMSLLSVIGSYEEAWKAIIMPPRQDYSMHDLGSPFSNLTMLILP